MTRDQGRSSGTPRRRRLRGPLAVILLGGVAGFGLAQARCTTSYPNGTHPWGTYGTCLVLQSDLCKAVDGGCFPAVNSAQVTLAGNLDAGTIYYYRSPDAPVIGRQVGTHFELVMETADGGLTETVCGCTANITETIWGALQESPPVGSCPTDAGGCGVAFDAGVPEDWLQTDAGIDPSATYSGFTATAIDEISEATGVAQPDAGCPCLPCRVVYSLIGSQ